MKKYSLCNKTIFKEHQKCEFFALATMALLVKTLKRVVNFKEKSSGTSYSSYELRK